MCVTVVYWQIQQKSVSRFTVATQCTQSM